MSAVAEEQDDLMDGGDDLVESSRSHDHPLLLSLQTPVGALDPILFSFFQSVFGQEALKT